MTWGGISGQEGRYLAGGSHKRPFKPNSKRYNCSTIGEVGVRRTIAIRACFSNC